MPRSIDNLVAGKALFLRADEVLKKGMEGLVAQPSYLPLTVEVPLGMGEEGTVVEHPQSADRSVCLHFGSSFLSQRASGADIVS